MESKYSDQLAELPILRLHMSDAKPEVRSSSLCNVLFEGQLVINQIQLNELMTYEERTPAAVAQKGESGGAVALFRKPV